MTFNSLEGIKIVFRSSPCLFRRVMKLTTFNIGFVILTALILGFTPHICLSQNPRVINYSIREGLPSSEIYEIFCDSNGFLWFASDNGVARFDGKDFQKFNVNDSLSDPIVFGFHEDPFGRIWFRTFTGKLSYYEHGKIIRYPFNNITAELANRALMTQIYIDSLKTLWISFDKSFVRIDDKGAIILRENIPPQTMQYFQAEKNHNMVGTHGMLKRINRIKLFDKIFPIQVSDTTQWLQSSYALKVENKLYLEIGRAHV